MACDGWLGQAITLCTLLRKDVPAKKKLIWVDSFYSDLHHIIVELQNQSDIGPKFCANTSTNVWDNLDRGGIQFFILPGITLSRILRN